MELPVHEDAFVYVPRCMTAVLSDYLGATIAPKVPGQLLELLVEYDVPSPQHRAIDVLTALQNDLLGLRIDRIGSIYAHELLTHHTGPEPTYMVHIEQLPDHYDTPSDYEMRRRMAVQLLNRALGFYKETHMLETVEDVFADYIQRCSL